MDIKETEILGDNIGEHWYYRSKASAIMKLLERESVQKVLDVGAGSGLFSRHLLAHSSAVEAWCIDTSYPEDTHTIESGKPIHFQRSIEQSEVDTVLLMDVLEHVDDDQGLLAQYVQMTPRGTRFLISVPAFQFLWSSHDAFLGHKRRYRLQQLTDTIECAGLQPRTQSYYFAFVLPIAAVTRVVGSWGSRWISGAHSKARSQLTRHSPIVNGFLSAVCLAEVPLLGHNRLAGLTAFCLADKR